jgi:hypothetical protein
MKKMKINFAALALVLAVVLGFTTRSNATVEKGKSTATVWFYNAAGSTQADLQNGGNWATNSGSCSASGTRPCQITVDAADQAELTDYLSDFTKSQILAMSVNRKP